MTDILTLNRLHFTYILTPEPDPVLPTLLTPKKSKIRTRIEIGSSERD